MEDVKKTKAREKYEEFLKKFVKENCNENGYVEANYDYDDELTPNDIYKVYDMMEKDKDLNFETALEQLFDDNAMLYDSVKDNFIDYLRREIEDAEDEDLLNEYDNTEDIYEDLNNVGYMGVDYNIKDLLKNTTLKFNIMFATPNEENYDMSSISSTFLQGEKYSTSENKDTLIQNANNALSYLIHQQGHTIKEVLNDYYGFKKSDNQFIRSVSEELDNNPTYGMDELTCLVELSGEQISEFFDTLEGRNEDKNIKNFEFDKNIDIGLFNEWNGSGSLLEIKLEKPFIISKDLVRNFQIENNGYGRNTDRGCTVDDVYGLISSCWKEDSLTSTNKEPELLKEDIYKTMDEFTKEIDKKIDEENSEEDEDER